ncbi:hypothetical protein FG386_001469 [Cryptosporidium ryanae]|uniref:uncharacterized protein n=1 Tax=Cryptosporidium ryanae TaxID=515981 RepID=UPI00351A47A4|nr:hypothetical protein FG386_001469 [Cryptosporidium ryanae]
MWGLWNNREKNDTNAATENLENVKELELNAKITKDLKDDYSISESVKECKLLATTNENNYQDSRVKTNGAIIGEEGGEEKIMPGDDEKKNLHSECMRKIHNSFTNLIGIMEDFNNAQENEKAYEKLGSRVNENNVFVNLGSMGDIKCARFDPGAFNSNKSEDEFSSLSTYAAKCSFGNTLTPKQVYDFLVNIENKTLYDTTCSESSMIYKLGSYSMFKQCYRGMMGVQGREFLLIGSNYVLCDDCYVLIATSTKETKNILNNEEIDVKDSYVRGEIIYVGFVVRKYKGETELFFAQKMDLGGAVPLMLQRIVLSTQLQSLNALKKHLIDNKNLYFSELTGNNAVKQEETCDK